MSENINRTLGEIIKQVIVDKGLVQADIAKKMNVSRQVINQVDRRKHFDYEFLNSLKEATGIDFTQYIPAIEYVRNSDVNNNINKNALDHVNEKIDKIEDKGVPMYNAAGAGSGIEIYTDNDSTKVLGYLNFPGVTRDSIALQVFGESMHPTLENGMWVVMRPVMNKTEIAWGEVYYIEWGDFRMFKRLLTSDNDDEIILWSDNQLTIINGKPVYSPIRVKKNDIRSLWLVTDTYKRSSN